MAQLWFLNRCLLFVLWFSVCSLVKIFPFVLIFLATEGTKASIVKDVVFPPVYEPSNDPDNPAGHLQIFGSQRPPSGPVKEYNTVLRAQEFWDEHVSKLEPLVYRGAITDSPAFSLWTDEYLKENYGDLDVLTELKTENRTHGITGRMLLGDFIDVYKKKNLYIVTVLPDPMRRDLPWLPSIRCGTFKDFLHELNFWMSSGGTRSVIHFDADHNIHCLVTGRKDFMMIHPKFASILNVTRPPQFGSGYSSINPDVVDLNRYPGVPQVEWTYSTLGPGDCIYIPSGYIHQVRSYKGNRTISATMLFTASLDESFDGHSCENESYEYRPLSEANVHWTYNKGDKTIDMGYQNVEKFRQSMLAEFDELKVDKLYGDKISEYLEQSFDLDEEDTEALQRDTLEVFRKFLDPTDKGYVTREDIRALSQDTLKEIARRTEAPHGPVAGSPNDRGGAFKEKLEKLKDEIDEEERKYMEKEEL